MRKRTLVALIVAALATVAAAIVAVVLVTRDGEEPERRAAPQPLSAEEIMDRFERVTGDRLERPDDGSFGSFEALDAAASNPHDSSLLATRYGSFQLFVYPTFAEARESVARVGTPGPDGIAWEQSSSQWTAHKAYGNVVLLWTASERETDERFERLDRILKVLDDLPERLEEALPAEERPCEEVGIDPAAGREGTCKLGRRTLVVVNRDTPLEVPGLRIEDVEVEIGKEIVPEGESEPLVPPEGVHVFLSFRITNTSQEELLFLHAQLEVGERRFDPSGADVFLTEPYPIAAGETAEETLVFDIPEELADEAASEGGLLVPGYLDQWVVVEDAGGLGRIRVAE